MKLVVALITGHMSFRTYNPPVFDGKELLSDPTVIKWQLRFVRYFAERFKGEDVIVSWDLGNEPIHMPGIEDKPCIIILYVALVLPDKASDSEYLKQHGIEEIIE